MSRQTSTAHLAVPVNAQDHVRGLATGTVTLVEYGDFQCPSCGEAFPIVEALIEQLGDRLRLVFRNFPLTTIHPYAEDAAESAEAAGSQGRFWEMHRLLFEHQAALETESLAQYGASIGLDVPVFDRDDRALPEAAPVPQPCSANDRTHAFDYCRQPRVGDFSVWNQGNCMNTQNGD